MPPELQAQVSIHKLDAHGSELWCYDGFVLSTSDTQITLEARFDREAVDIHGLQLRNGDRFVETFYFDRWYNVFAIYHGETNAFKGWYCNITRPAWMDSHHLYAEDLALDLIVLPDRQVSVMDQEQFEALKLPGFERNKAHAALDELIRLAQAAEDPFRLDP